MKFLRKHTHPPFSLYGESRSTLPSASQFLVFYKLIAILCLLSFCLCAAGCNRTQSDDVSTKLAPTSKESASSGPLTVTLSLSATSISLAETLTLTLEAVAPEESEITFPDFAASVGDFTLVDTKVLPKKLTGKGVSMGRIWFLSPFLAGDYVIPDLAVKAQSNGKLSEVSFPGQTITVTSFLDPKDKEMALADIQAPLSLPVPPLYYLLAGCALFVVLALLVYIVRRKKTPQKLPPPIAAHLQALEKINMLLGENKNITDYSLFYNRLSLILRRYIEKRFGIKAPEQTSEEFLQALGSASMFSDQQKNLLKHFLLHSDLIKFAQMTPTDSEIMESVELCRNFISATGDEGLPGNNKQRGEKT
ncbi:MAG: hypothetical protein KQH63_00235 [Desulfobulbaceae bacterium]|nr:hypothetical protein [Desulfobulbaceae bacterium]